jgi:D-threonine aldolase
MAENPWYVVGNAADIPSPSLLVYAERLEANIRTAVRIAGGAARLRPHVKTHKCGRIVRLLRAAGIDRFKCATIAEAEMLALEGAADAMVAFPLVGENARRFARLCAAYPGTRFSTIADSPDGARGLSAALAAQHVTATVALDVDMGMHRTGVASTGQAVSLYGLLCSLPGIAPGGLHCYDGHNNASDLAERTRVADACHAAARALKAELENHGRIVPRMVMGGTPPFPCYAAFPDCELSPGTCFLQDWHNQRLYPDMAFAAAALVMARVVSRPGPGLLTIDCGHKSIAPEMPHERGLIMNLGSVRTVKQSEEHWVLESPDAGSLGIGAEVYILPEHICPTFAQYDAARVVDPSGRWTESWPITARGRSLGI